MVSIIGGSVIIVLEAVSSVEDSSSEMSCVVVDIISLTAISSEVSSITSEEARGV